MIEVIAEHSVCMDLLPERANVLDAGCRGMIFTNGMRRLGHNVLAIDCDDLKGIEDYYRVAIGGVDGRVGVMRGSDPQATSICQGNEVMCMTLGSLCRMARVDFFDLIKLDIEASEYDVIMSMERPYAKQLSVEFHLHTNVYQESQVVLMVNKLEKLGYKTVQHEKTRQHGLPPNYWDSLFILK